jgi:rapamycin-insensitive companion of mTOR
LYLKLVISSLDYTSSEWGSRNLLSKALKEGSEVCKLYATRFLGVLVRSRIPNIAQWGIELLVRS